MSRATVDVDSVQTFPMWGLGYFAYQIILVRTASILMLTMNLILGTTTMAFMAFVAWRSSAMVPSMVVLYEQGQEAMVRMASVVQQALTGIRIVKGFSGQVLESEKFDAAAKLAQLHDTKSNRIVALKNGGSSNKAPMINLLPTRGCTSD